MFGSIANFLENSNSTYNDPFKIPPSALYRLVLSLERHTPDVINVLELVKMKKPLVSLGKSLSKIKIILSKIVNRFLLYWGG